MYVSINNNERRCALVDHGCVYHAPLRFLAHMDRYLATHG